MGVGSSSPASVSPCASMDPSCSCVPATLPSPGLVHARQQPLQPQLQQVFRPNLKQQLGAGPAQPPCLWATASACPPHVMPPQHPASPLHAHVQTGASDQTLSPTCSDDKHHQPGSTCDDDEEVLHATPTPHPTPHAAASGWVPVPVSEHLTDPYGGGSPQHLGRGRAAAAVAARGGGCSGPGAGGLGEGPAVAAQGGGCSGPALREPLQLVGGGSSRVPGASSAAALCGYSLAQLGGVAAGGCAGGSWEAMQTQTQTDPEGLPRRCIMRAATATASATPAGGLSGLEAVAARQQQQQQLQQRRMEEEQQRRVLRQAAAAAGGGVSPHGHPAAPTSHPAQKGCSRPVAGQGGLSPRIHLAARSPPAQKGCSKAQQQQQQAGGSRAVAGPGGGHHRWGVPEGGPGLMAVAAIAAAGVQDQNQDPYSNSPNSSSLSAAATAATAGPGRAGKAVAGPAPMGHPGCSSPKNGPRGRGDGGPATALPRTSPAPSPPADPAAAAAASPAVAGPGRAAASGPAAGGKRRPAAGAAAATATAREAVAVPGRQPQQHPGRQGQNEVQGPAKRPRHDVQRQQPLQARGGALVSSSGGGSSGSSSEDDRPISKCARLAARGRDQDRGRVGGQGRDGSAHSSLWRRRQLRRTHRRPAR